ncbi:MAG: hypothetical protein K0B52_00925 [FCB group bacterium]|nr:hypothetical protein [FCB group bacterium]
MRKTKLHLIALSILLLTSAMLFAWDGFYFITAVEHNEGIIISWQAKNEDNVAYYIVYRARSGSQVYDNIYTVNVINPGGVYHHVDRVFTKSTVSGDYRFDYYVRAVMRDGTYQKSPTVQATLGSLGVRQQTWGSIKAMFR